MLRKCTDEDISDEECEKVIDPFYDNYQAFVEEYIVPEVVSLYIARSFYRNATICFLDNSSPYILFISSISSILV